MMSGGVVPGGSDAQHGLRDRGDLRDSAVSMLRARLEEHLDHRHARERLRLDVLDVVDGRGERALEVRRRCAAPSPRAAARCSPDDRDDRDVDVGKDVGRHAHEWRARPTMSSSSATTMNVYGRLSASRTIHMIWRALLGSLYRSQECRPGGNEAARNSEQSRTQTGLRLFRGGAVCCGYRRRLRGVPPVVPMGRENTQPSLPDGPRMDDKLRAGVDDLFWFDQRAASHASPAVSDVPPCVRLATFCPASSSSVSAPPSQSKGRIARAALL